MKKILLVSRCAWTLYNFRAGLMHAIKSNGDVVICGGAGGDGFDHKIENMGVPFVPLPLNQRGKNPLGEIRLFWALYRWYRREKPEIVHHFTIKPVIYGSIAARLARVPRIMNTITGLGSAFGVDQRGWLRHLVTWLYRLALPCSHFTFFQNQDDLETLHGQHLVRVRKADLLPGSGVNCQTFAPYCFAKINRDRPLRFIMVSRLLRDKGVYEFVEAARMVRVLFPETQFHLLGWRDLLSPNVMPQADLEQWQKQGLIVWQGKVEDIRPYVAAADVAVLPSFYREGIPQVLLEAAAMAKPLIVTNNVGCREVVEHGVNGLLVPVKDGKALAEAMLTMIRNPEMRQKMGRAGREKMEREFDEGIVIDRIMAKYTQENV